MCVTLDKKVEEKYQGVTSGYKIYRKFPISSSLHKKEFMGEFHSICYKIGHKYTAKELSKNKSEMMSSLGNNPYGFHIFLEPAKLIGDGSIQIEVKFSKPVGYGIDDLYNKPCVIAREIELINKYDWLARYGEDIF